MALAEVISKLDDAESHEKQEFYLNIAKLLSDNTDSTYDGINNEHIKRLCCNILDELKKENELPQLAKLLQSLFQNKYLQKFLPEEVKLEVFKDVINTIDSNQQENVLVNYFSVLIQIPSISTIDNTLLNDLLQRMEDVLSNKNEPASTYAVCSYFQKFLRDFEERLSNFIPLLSKLVFLPLCHPSNKVREVAEKSLDMFPKILLYSSDEQATSAILKLLKESFCKDMLQLFKEKQELYVLKVWTHVVKALGNALSANLSSITPFFQIIEKGFKSPVDEICIASFNAWKSLIDSFSGCDGVLNDAKRLRFILKPFKNIARSNENVLSIACDTWMHLAWNLAGHLSSRFSEVCIPLLELTVGKISNGLPEKNFPKGGPVALVKKSCYLLLRFLEMPPSESFNRLSSPKRLPYIPYPNLQVPLDIKIITYHFREILHVVKIIVDVFGKKDDMKPYLDNLMKSVLFIVSTVIEDSNKESAEAVNHFLNFFSYVIETKVYSSLSCLKCLESLSKLPRKILVSHCFNCGSRKPQDVLCTSLLKLLLNPHLFPSEDPKRYFITYNRLIQAGIHESFHPLLNAHKFMHVIRSAIGTNTLDVEVLIEIWSGIATPLLEVIDKTQEVNQGDKQEHDFSCMYDVLLFPFEFIFPIYVHQFRSRPTVKLWTNLYKAFIRSASLVTTTSANEASENFCAKLKAYLKEDLLKKPHFFELLCLFIQSIMESIDFTGGTTSGTQGMDVALMIKRKKPLGNLTSFVDLLVMLLKAYHAHYIEAEDESIQSSAPTVQRKVHIVKNAAPLDILKTVFGSIKSGSTISLFLEQLADPISKLFVKSSQKRSVIAQNDAKLELLWNVISSSVERFYIGRYDSEFLALMSPILEATFSHSKRNFKERSRRFWFSTFGPNASSLKFPDSLKNLLKKMKLPLLPEDISPAEFSISPMADSLSEESIVVNPIVPKPSVIKSVFKSPLNVNGETTKASPKEDKQKKISIDDLPSEEFVKIDSPIVNTPRRRNVRKRKSYVPSLYNDLSQDTATLMSSSESQDTTNSASLEQMDCKESMAETKTTADQELMSTPSTSHKDIVAVCESVIKSPLSAKLENKLDQSLKSESAVTVKQVISIESSESEDEMETKKAKILTANHSQENKTDESHFVNNKISVFSKPGEKQLDSQNCRKNSRLSQSFSILTTKTDSEKIDTQKLSNSCIELINLSDSEDIIPSSQGSAEADSSVKLSNNGHHKLHPTNSSVIQKSEFCLSPAKAKEDFIPEILNSKVATSTPSKTKFQPPVNDDDNDGDVHKTLPENCENVLINVPISSDNYIVNNKSDTSSSVQVVHKAPQNAPSKDLVKFVEDANMQSNAQNDIKDCNFSLDAVDDLVDPAVPKPDAKSADETLHQVSSDIEMEHVPEVEKKVFDAEDTDKISQLPTYEPIAKRSRLSLKLSENDSLQNENYSKKLRKKNTNAIAKSELKPKRKKAVKKNDNVNKNNKDKLKNDNDKSKEIVPPNNKNSGEILNSTENEIVSKQVEYICLPANASNVKNIELEKKCVSDLIAVKSVKISNKSLDNMKINNETILNIDNTESCEIFEPYSSSSGELQDTEMTSADSNSLGISLLSNVIKNKSSNSDSLVSEALERPSSAELIDSSSDSMISECEANLKVSQEKSDYSDAVPVTIIPSSLENDDSSHMLNKLVNNTANVETSVETSDHVITKEFTESNKSCDEPPIETEKGCLNGENEINSNLNHSSVDFSIIEDNLSCEMHNIVNSIADVSSDNSIDDNLSENKSVSTAEAKSLTLVNNSEENQNDKNRKNDSLINQQEDQCAKSSVAGKEIFSQSSDVCLQDSSSSVGECNSNSCDMIISENIDDALEISAKVVECSDIVDAEHDDNLAPSKNAVETNSINNAIGQPVSESGRRTFTPELDHSYSISKESRKRLVDSSVKNSEIVNVSIKLNESEDDSDEIDVVTVDPEHEKFLGCPYMSMPNSSNIERDILYLVKDIVFMVEELEIEAYNSADQNYEDYYGSDMSSVPSDLNHVADKENEVADSKNEDRFAKGSKKRKIKPPIRSPFNFRQRAKVESSKKVLTKSVKSLSISQIKSVTENKDLVIKSLFPKDDFKEDDSTDNSMAKIISSIVDSVTVEEEDINSELYPNAPTSSQVSKGQKISNDELTDINTRLNAQIAHQTRRIKMIADSQPPAETDNDSLNSDVVTVCPDDSSTALASILKKRKSSGPVTPKKIRKVTFASPLIQELVFESCSESRGIETITMNRIQSLKRRKKILQEKNKTEKASPPQPPVANDPEEVPSSSEYQDSDVLDFNEIAVSPTLINCPDDVSNILKDLTSPSWVQGLESLLVSKNIKSIGDLCKLNIHQVKALPFKSPKVATLHKALISYLGVTQEATLQKFKTIDDGSFGEMDYPANSKTVKGTVNSDECAKLTSLEETVKDMLKKESLKELPLHLLGQLIQACGKAVFEKNKQS